MWARERGHAVFGVDRSPGAIRVARKRGLKRALVGDLTHLPVDRAFDTVLVVGQQLGLGRSRAALDGTLSELARVTKPGERLVADLSDPTGPEAWAESEYLDRHAVGDGLAYRRFRVEYDELAGPWIDLLMATPDALAGVIAGTPWTVERLLETESAAYGVVLGR
ncbi:class I SAM-dependent methyltransferase [Halalkalicoccus jeotgali]|uniref:class I SAM-dependent methyltransferase n=1 Tax=Halalkalicoccus jeotgali TaxID=413810 RepID=UPI00373AF5AD